jgi:kumamolisin
LAKLGKPTAGFMNPLLYNNPTNFRDIVDGSNDIDGTLRKYQAGPGWDACSGLGSPLGSQLAQTMSG